MSKFLDPDRPRVEKVRLERKSNERDIYNFSTLLFPFLLAQCGIYIYIYIEARAHASVANLMKRSHTGSALTCRVG